MDCIFLIFFFIGLGIWTKWRNTIHMRKLAAETKKDYEEYSRDKTCVEPDNAHDSMGVAEMGAEILGEDNLKGGPHV